jgi:thioredoxin reductase (NADPH)
MSRPIIFTIDDDPQVLRAITRDLRSHYGKEYKVMSTESASEALETLVEMKNAGDVVAIFISDQRMPEMPGVDFLQQAIKVYPEAKRVLLTAYSDTDAAIKAINDVQLDYYLMKPWDPPEDKLFPIINDLLNDWQSYYTPAFRGIKLIGYQFSPQSHTVKDYLGSNLIPYQWLDIEKNDEAKSVLALNGLATDQLPIVFFEDGSYKAKPTIVDIAQKIGINAKITNEIYDVVSCISIRSIGGTTYPAY